MEDLKWFQRKENWWIGSGILFAIIAFLTPLIIMMITGLNFSLKNFNSLSSVGDFFGGTTVGVLTLASMLFVIAAIVMQKQELELQRKELELTREELGKTREEHAMSNKTMKLQQFETTFFNMIKNYNDILNGIHHVDTNHYGREALIEHFSEIHRTYRQNVKKFTVNFLTIDHPDEEQNFFSFAEAIAASIKCGIKKEDDFLFNGFIEGEDDIETINKKLITTSRTSNILYIYHAFNYKNLVELCKHIPNNKMLEEFEEKFINSNEYLIMAFNQVVEGDNYMLSNYIKVIKAIFELIDGKDFLTNSLTQDEKKSYMKLFLSQLSRYEVNLLYCYMEYGDDSVLKNFQNEYTLFQEEDLIKHGVS